MNKSRLCFIARYTSPPFPLFPFSPFLFFLLRSSNDLSRAKRKKEREERKFLLTIAIFVGKGWGGELTKNEEVDSDPNNGWPYVSVSGETEKRI